MPLIERINSLVEKAKKNNKDSSIITPVPHEPVMCSSNPNNPDDIWLDDYNRKLDITPDMKALGYFKDNPGGNWLENERWRSIKNDSHIGISVTAGFRKIWLPVKTLMKFPGLNNEHNHIKGDDERVVNLARDMKENGYDEEYKVFINVTWKGIPSVNEGNHRIRAAEMAGIEFIPCTLLLF